jgi:putative alpha-1,2-mannosidase
MAWKLPCSKYYNVFPDLLWCACTSSRFPSKNIFDIENTGSSTEMGALLEFPTGNATSSSTEILVRVGVSFISTEQACANAEEESPDFDFDGAHAASRAAWNELLGRIQVNSTGVAAETVELLYSSIYRTHISPADCKLGLLLLISTTIANNPQTLTKIPTGTQLSHITTPSTAT